LVKILSGDEDDVASFSHFLASSPGDALRIDGLKWLASALNEAPKTQYWRRRDATGDSIVSVLAIALAKDGPVLAKDADARNAVVTLTAYTAAQQVPGALALQERVKHLK
jgi:hypothetical protein